MKTPLWSLVTGAVLVVVVLVALAPRAMAQNGLESASGETSLFQSSEGGFAIALDANDAKVSFTMNSSFFGFGAPRLIDDFERAPCGREEREAEKARKACEDPDSRCSQAHKSSLAECKKKPTSAEKDACTERADDTRLECQEGCYASEARTLLTCQNEIRKSLPCGAELDAFRATYKLCKGTKGCAQKELDEYSKCADQQRLVGWSNNLTLSFAAQDGERDLFSSGEFTPGVELTEKLGYQTELGDLGVVSGFFSGNVNVVDRKTAEESGEDVFKLSDTTGTTLQLGLGANWTPTPKTGTFGISGSWERNWNVPEAIKTSDVCVLKTQGTDTKGNPVTVSKCDDRYVGPIETNNGAVFRVDWASPRFRIGSWRAYSPGQIVYSKELSSAEMDALTSGDDPFSSSGILSNVSLGLIASSSVEVRDGSKPVYDFAIGPALYKAFQPLGILGAVLFEFNDINNASDEAPSFSDKFFVRLYVGVPFE